MFAGAALSGYRVNRAEWWFTAVMSVYFVASFLAGYLLLFGRGVARLFRIGAKAHGKENQKGPIFARSREAGPLSPINTQGFPPSPDQAAEPISLAAATPRRAFIVTATTAAVVAPVAASIYGFARERLDFEITHVPVELGAKGAALRGRTMVQLSDIHIGPYLSTIDVRRVVDIANEMAPDLVFLTGDFVTFRGDSQYDCVRELSRLRPRAGVYGCLGNHEIYTHTEASITKLFKADGFEILRFEGRRVTLGNSTINLAGIDFYHDTRQFDLDVLRPYFRQGEVNLLLTHNPNAFDYLGDLPVDLCVSGHTHGGQLRLEFIESDVSPARLITQYISGKFERDGRQLYVNRGLGTIGVPIRLGSRPEITVYHLA
jgi:predicted MPP superfamily phosphohydrolase